MAKPNESGMQDSLRALSHALHLTGMLSCKHTVPAGHGCLVQACWNIWSTGESLLVGTFSQMLNWSHCLLEHIIKW